MKGKDAPRVVNVGVWSAAVIGALAFAVTLGSYIVGGLNNEISADTQAQQAGVPTQQCEAGSTMYTINNYPGIENLLPGGHATYYQDGDMNWRCSYVCVPDNTDLKTYLTSSKAGGQNLVLVDNPTGFNNIFKEDPEAAMTRSVIISSSAKTYNTSGEYARRCSGPNSVNYGAITDEAGETIDTLERVESAYKAPTREEIVSGAAFEAGEAGQSERAVAPVTGGSASSSDTPENDLVSCTAYINDFLVNYARLESSTKTDEKNFYNGMYKFYVELKSAISSGGTSIDTTLGRCLTYKGTIEKFLQQNKDLQADQVNSSASKMTCTKETLLAYIEANLKDKQLADILNEFANSFTASQAMRGDVCRDQIAVIDQFNNKVKGVEGDLNKIVAISALTPWTAVTARFNGSYGTGSLIKDGGRLYWSTRVKIKVKTETREFSRYVYFRAEAEAGNTSTPLTTRFKAYYNQTTNFLGMPQGITYPSLNDLRNS